MAQGSLYVPDSPKLLFDVSIDNLCGVHRIQRMAGFFMASPTNIQVMVGDVFVSDGGAEDFSVHLLRYGFPQKVQDRRSDVDELGLEIIGTLTDIGATRD